MKKWGMIVGILLAVAAMTCVVIFVVRPTLPWQVQSENENANQEVNSNAQVSSGGVSNANNGTSTSPASGNTNTSSTSSTEKNESSGNNSGNAGTSETTEPLGGQGQVSTSVVSAQEMEAQVPVQISIVADNTRGDYNSQLSSMFGYMEGVSSTNGDNLVYVFKTYGNLDVYWNGARVFNPVVSDVVKTRDGVATTSFSALLTCDFLPTQKSVTDVPQVRQSRMLIDMTLNNETGQIIDMTLQNIP